MLLLIVGFPCTDFSLARGTHYARNCGQRTAAHVQQDAIIVQAIELVALIMPAQEQLGAIHQVIACFVVQACLA
jgi:site-specific DNA-cytosine methylase